MDDFFTSLLSRGALGRMRGMPNASSRMPLYNGGGSPLQGGQLSREFPQAMMAALAGRNPKPRGPMDPAWGVPMPPRGGAIDYDGEGLANERASLAGAPSPLDNERARLAGALSPLENERALMARIAQGIPEGLPGGGDLSAPPGPPQLPPLHSDPLPQYRDQIGTTPYPGGGDPRVPTNWMHGNPGTPPVGVNPNVPTRPPLHTDPYPPPMPRPMPEPQHKFRQMQAQDDSLPMRFQKQNNPRYQAPSPTGGWTPQPNPAPKPMTGGPAGMPATPRMPTANKPLV